VIQGVCALRLCELVVYVVKEIEGIHVVELWWVFLIEYFLLVRVKIFSIVYDNFTIACANKPLIVGFQERNIKRMNLSIH
jgi:hypothetical protein